MELLLCTRVSNARLFVLSSQTYFATVKVVSTYSYGFRECIFYCRLFNWIDISVKKYNRVVKYNFFRLFFQECDPSAATDDSALSPASESAAATNGTAASNPDSAPAAASEGDPSSPNLEPLLSELGKLSQLEDEDAATEAAKALAINVKEMCHNAEKLT